MEQRRTHRGVTITIDYVMSLSFWGSVDVMGHVTIRFSIDLPTGGPLEVPSLEF